MFRIGCQGLAAWRLLRSLRAVFPSSHFNHRSRLKQMRELVFVQALVRQPTIDRFDVGVLVRLAGFNEAQREAPITSPLHHRLATELLAAIGAAHTRGRPRLGARRSGNRPSAVRSKMKSVDHISFATSGCSSGWRSPSATFVLFWRRTCSAPRCAAPFNMRGCLVCARATKLTWPRLAAPYSNALFVCVAGDPREQGWRSLRFA